MAPDLDKYFLRELPEKLGFRHRLDLLLLVIGQRPAALIVDYSDEPDLENLCVELDLSFRIYTEKEQKLGRSGFFISKSEDRFKLLENSEGRFCGLSDIDVGRFLDYPEDSVEYFAENIGGVSPEEKTRRKLQELVENNELDRKNLRDIEFISYVPKPKRESIEKALREGRICRKKIEELKDDCPELAETYIQGVFRNKRFLTS